MYDWLSNEPLAPLGIAYKRLMLAGIIAPIASVEHGNEARTLAEDGQKGGKNTTFRTYRACPLSSLSTCMPSSRRCAVFPIISSRALAMRHNTRRDDKQNRPGWWVEETAPPDPRCNLPLDERSRLMIVLFPEPYSARYIA